MPKRLVLGIFAAGICVVVAGAASGVPPQTVSPAGVVELRCPTFSWSAVSGAAAYELLVYQVSPAGDVGTEPLLSARLPGGAAAWTPPGASCLAAGGRYAWTLRVLGKEAEGGWAESVLFEVAAAPSLVEVEAALATLRRYLGAEHGDRLPAAEAMAVAERLRDAAASRAAGGPGPHSVMAAAVPSLGTPSLTVDSNVALGAASNLFKDGSVFLWDDTAGNTALGRLALASATGTATNNTAFGREALRDTEAGLFQDLQGSYNTAMGDRALRSNTTGNRNTASGYRALYSNTTGYRNTASGYRALFSNTTGRDNTASGYRALYSNAEGHRNTAVGRLAGHFATTGDDNIFLGSGSLGDTVDTHTIRIGGETGTGAGEQNRTFIAGIAGITVSGSTVLVSSSGQLGVASSSASFKEGIEELGEVSQRLAALRPVSFRYRSEILPGGGSQVGLLAEEVAEFFPELVTRDSEGRPFGVRYDLLSVLSLAELQQQQRQLQAQQREFAALRERLAALERGEKIDERRTPWWRRLSGKDRASP